MLFTIAVLVHNTDHLRRGADAVPIDVFVAGTSAIVLEVGIVALVLARHRLAPLAAIAVGASLAPAYVLVHFLPKRSWLSDSLTSAAEASPLSYGAAGLEVLAATVVAVAGVVVLRRRGGLASATQACREEAPFREGLVHPLTLVFLVANLAVVAISLTQL